MAAPNKPKDMKPKAEGGGDAPAGAEPKAGGGGGGIDLKLIILVVAIFLASILGSAGTLGALYFLGPTVLVPAIVSQLPKPAEGAEGAAGEPGEEGHEGGEKGHGSEAAKLGMNMELDEFTVNLKVDPEEGGDQYLRAKMSLSIKVPEAEYCGGHKEGEGGGGEGGHGGGGGADPCQAAFNKKMGRYVPTIRDIVNATLMKRTATALASVEGQENLKDEIKEQINHLIEPDYQVIRVNFADFLVQR